MDIIQTVKEVIRSGLNKIGVYDLVRTMRGKSLDHLSYKSLEDRFAHIYSTRMWALGNPDNPGSGSGSSLNATAKLRAELPGLLKGIGTRTLLDLGCGDFTWMRTVDLRAVDYVGADIVQSLIDENTKTYGGAGVRFVCANAVSDELPDADTVLIREVLFHLSFDDVFAVLRNVLSKSRRFLLITTDRHNAFNADITSGDWRLLNFEAAPFRFPEPDLWVDEDSAVRDRRLGVWRSDAIRRALEARGQPPSRLQSLQGFQRQPDQG